MSGANSGTRYKIDLNLDSKIADHVTKISVNPAGSNTPVQFTRLKTMTVHLLIFGKSIIFELAVDYLVVQKF